MNKALVFPPAVFTAGKSYQIFARVSVKCMFWVEVNGKRYYDASNGILRSRKHIHSVSVPAEELDSARAYTVFTQNVVKRLPYKSVCRKPVKCTFPFRPIPARGAINIYHIADTHGRSYPAIEAARKSCKALDLLILNGDIFDASYSEKEFDVIYEIAGELTGGSIPIVFSRGNHDLRGEAAELLEQYSPVVNGKTYYTFRTGRVWGIILDCGEDKADSNEEYGSTICCEAFRKDETEFLKAVIADAANEYNADGIEYRLVISHNPFCFTSPPPFDIEQPLYSEWSALLKEYVKPDVMLCGHLHITAVSEVGGEFDSLGQPCTVIIGAAPGSNKLTSTTFTGCSLTLENGNVFSNFT